MGNLLPLFCLFDAYTGEEDRNRVPSGSPPPEIDKEKRNESCRPKSKPAFSQVIAWS